MQPLLFSVTEAKLGRPGWVRAGQGVCYFRNLFSNPSVGGRNDARRSGFGHQRQQHHRRRTQVRSADVKPVSASELYSISFVLTFRHRHDVCYVAYHFPYTFSFLQSHLELWTRQSCGNEAVHFRRERLCQSIGGNRVDVLTITAALGDSATGTPSVGERELVLLTGRVHPGESNGSWMVHGAIRFLMSDHPRAIELRSRVVFKVIPMLNPDGVVNGSTRCSLSGQDLNRQWLAPNLKLHPNIYHSRGLVQFVVETLGRQPFLFCDFHGHSRQSNIFLYGNNPEESWRSTDATNNAADKRFRVSQPNETEIAEQLQRMGAPAFAIEQCRFKVDKSKESSARVALWRAFGLSRCHTIEATYAGFDRGPYLGYQIGTRELCEMGQQVCEAVLQLVKRGTSADETQQRPYSV